jgi:hypothetical protein
VEPVTAFLTGRCDPYGHESGGPKRLLGGMYGPDHEGPQKWFCENQATHRVRMVCKLYGHSGQVLEICDDHHGEIQRRQSGLCTACAYPPEARSTQERIEHAQALLQQYYVDEKRAWLDPKCSEARREIEAGRVRMDELWQSGRIKRVSMVLVEVS